jgi:hypothetical protein
MNERAKDVFKLFNVEFVVTENIFEPDEAVESRFKKLSSLHFVLNGINTSGSGFGREGGFEEAEGVESVEEFISELGEGCGVFERF